MYRLIFILLLVFSYAVLADYTFESINHTHYTVYDETIKRHGDNIEFVYGEDFDGTRAYPKKYAADCKTHYRNDKEYIVPNTVGRGMLNYACSKADINKPFVIKKIIDSNGHLIYSNMDGIKPKKVIRVFGSLKN